MQRALLFNQFSKLPPTQANWVWSQEGPNPQIGDLIMYFFLWLRPHPPPAPPTSETLSFHVSSFKHAPIAQWQQFEPRAQRLWVRFPAVTLVLLIFLKDL